MRPGDAGAPDMTGEEAVRLIEAAHGHPELRACRGYRMDGATVRRLPAGAPGDLTAQEH
jgi:hypothetical protein